MSDIAGHMAAMSPKTKIVGFIAPRIDCFHLHVTGTNIPVLA